MTAIRIGMIGVFDPDYARNAVLRAALEHAGCEIVSVQLAREANTLGRIRELLARFGEVRDCDVILIPCFNQLLAPVVVFLAARAGKPLLLDYMVGLADMQEDRGQISGFKARLFRFIDRFNLTRMTAITDTQAHIGAFERLLNAKFPRLHVIPVGVRESLPLLPAPPDDGMIRVQFVGTYIPFHGVDVILRAAALLRDDARIAIELIGNGQTYKQSVALAEELALTNVTFTKGFFRPPGIYEMMTPASVLLGVFGAAAKTDYVVPNKVFDALMLGRSLITAESTALRECFTPGEQLITVPAGDPSALAAAIRALADSPAERARLAAAGRGCVQSTFLPEHISPDLMTLIQGLLS